jgi:enediyne polyketide synthase
VGLSKLRVSWVKFIGHGQAIVEELPEFIKLFMDSMRPVNNKQVDLLPMPQSYKELSQGKLLFNFNKEYKKHILEQKIFETSLEDSNLIGNIYFANYSKWIGRTFDQFFYMATPEFYKNYGINGEFICLKCNIDYLREAMPFDKIFVKMYLSDVYEFGADFIYEFLRLENGSKSEKLAVAKQKIVLTCNENRSRKTLKIPEKLIERFIK